MGSGTYYAVGYGCAELPQLSESKEIELGRILDEHDVQTSYEGSSNYAVIGLLNTLNDGWRRGKSIPGGVMKIEDLPGAIKRVIGEADLKAAVTKWDAVCAAAMLQDITLPEGELLWLCDYD